jgi:hypothetical protein
LSKLKSAAHILSPNIRGFVSLKKEKSQGNVVEVIGIARKKNRRLVRIFSKNSASGEVELSMRSSTVLTMVMGGGGGGSPPSGGSHSWDILWSSSSLVITFMVFR